MGSKLVLLIFLLNEIYSYFQFGKNIYRIQKNLTSFITLVNESDKNILFFMQGYQENSTDDLIHIINISNSNTIYGNYFMNLSVPNKHFQNLDIILTGDNFQNIIFSGRHLCFSLKSEVHHHSNESYEPIKGTLKKINSTYFYLSENGTLNQFEVNITSNETRNPIKILNSYKFLENIKNITSISCDTDNNNIYYICTYFYENNKFGIAYTYLTLHNNFYFNYEISSNPDNYFNKIVHFKGTNKFISIHSENADIMRMRYFELNFNLKINKLYTENFNYDYLDIKRSNFNPYYYSNDIVALEDDKIMIISVNDKGEYMITKIQFYENEKKITSKTYTSFYIQNLRLFNPKLSIWKNCLVFSFLYGQNEPDFLIFGYPEAIENFNLTSHNNIKIGKLKMINNNLMNNTFLALKILCKVISIPENFVFVNSINNLEIKIGDYFAPENDEIIFRQYKKQKKSLFIYKAVSFGEFKENTFQIFPPGEIEPLEDKVVSEGDEGIIYINIDSCKDGFYEVEGMDNICTNTRPQSYYFDKNKNIFKKCHSRCSECLSRSDNNLNMKCLKCIKGYTYNNKTFNCELKENEKDLETKILTQKSIYFWFFLIIIIAALLSALYLFCFKKNISTTSKQVDYATLKNNSDENYNKDQLMDDNSNEDE